MRMTKEVWKPIKDYEGLYEVSSFGNVRRLSGEVFTKNGDYHYVKERTLKLHENVQGYLEATLYKIGKAKRYRVHRLVADAFIKGKSKKKILSII